MRILVRLRRLLSIVASGAPARDREKTGVRWSGQTSLMNEGCLVCGEVSGEVPVPGGPLEDNDQVSVFHSPIVEPATDVFAGYLFVAPRRHATGFADLSDAEAVSMGRALTRWSRALERTGAEQVYILGIGHHVRHLHVHLIPRWPGTPEDVAWTQVDEWPGARRGGLALAIDVVGQLRAADSGALS
jgi:histidine triad (HIT) family protein